MEIIRVQYFRSVYQIGSIRKASEILNMTPGALSKSLKVLEQELGESLFVPQGRNIIASDFGKKFYILSEGLVNTYTRLQADLKNVEINRTFTVATWEVFSSYFLSRFSQELNPDIKIKVLERVPNDLEKSIVEGHADVGLTYAPIPHPELEFVKCGVIEYGAYSTKDTFKKYKLSEIPFAVPITIFPESPTGVRELDNWPQELERKIKFQFELLETALDVARSGKAAVFLSLVFNSIAEFPITTKLQASLDRPCVDSKG
jgi:DNA-binding transcriptional LysR family regulator